MEEKQTDVEVQVKEEQQIDVELLMMEEHKIKVEVYQTYVQDQCLDENGTKVEEQNMGKQQTGAIYHNTEEIIFSYFDFSTSCLKKKIALVGLLMLGYGSINKYSFLGGLSYSINQLWNTINSMCIISISKCDSV